MSLIPFLPTLPLREATCPDHVCGSPTLSMPLPIKYHLTEEFDTIIHMGLKKKIPLDCELHKGR